MDLDIDAFYRDVDARVVAGGETHRDYFPAVMRAMKLWNNRRASWTEDHRGFTLRFGPDDYWFSNSIHLIRGMRLLGAGGSGSWTGTRFFFPEGVHGFVSEFAKTPIEHDLRLMSVAVAGGLISGGRSLVIVALVDTRLHIRIFDASGEKVVDKTENELVSGEVLTALKKRLNPLPRDSDLSKADKIKIIEDATLIAGHTRVIPAEFSNLAGRSDGSMIESIYLEASGKSIVDCHGILMIGSLVLRDVTISGFSGDGVHISATLANKNARDYGSASGWLMENCNIFDCWNGVYVKEGGDNSAGTAIRILVSNNTEWGIADLSTTGGTYIGCIAHNNKAGSYRTRLNPGESTTNSSLFMNCYAEGDQPPAKIGSPAMVIGGIMNLSEDSNAIWLNADNGYAHFPNGMHVYGNRLKWNPTRAGDTSKPIDQRANLYIGDNGNAAPGDTMSYAMTLELVDYTAPDPPQPTKAGSYKLRYHFVTGDNNPNIWGWWNFSLPHDVLGYGALSALRFSTNEADVGANQVWLENGFYIGDGESSEVEGILVRTGEKPPTKGPRPGKSWKVGDRILNSTPDPNDRTRCYAGWIYTTSGWKPYGKIEP